MEFRVRVMFYDIMILLGHLYDIIRSLMPGYSKQVNSKVNGMLSIYWAIIFILFSYGFNHTFSRHFYPRCLISGILIDFISFNYLENLMMFAQ